VPVWGLRRGREGGRERERERDYIREIDVPRLAAIVHLTRDSSLNADFSSLRRVSKTRRIEDRQVQDLDLGDPLFFVTDESASRDKSR
jgi:hypothetical protein